MAGFVLDASTALSWCFADELTPASAALRDRLVDEYAMVPSLWPLEVANILTTAERRGRIDPIGIAEYLTTIALLDIRIDTGDCTRALHDIIDIARREGLSSYDAAYLDLAQRAGLPLATRDRALAGAARRRGVAVVES